MSTDVSLLSLFEMCCYCCYLSELVVAFVAKYVDGFDLKRLQGEFSSDILKMKKGWD